MITAPALVEFGTLTTAGDLGDDSDFTEVLIAAPAAQANVSTGFEALGLSGIPTAITAVRLRARVTASADFAAVWNASAERLRWRVGAAGTIAEVNPTTDIPKTGAFAWVETDILATDPDGNAWTFATVGALRLEAKVAWNSAALGTVELQMSEARAVAYVEQEVSVHACVVGDRDPLEEWVGDWMHTVTVGDREPLTRWVGEEE